MGGLGKPRWCVTSSTLTFSDISDLLLGREYYYNRATNVTKYVWTLAEIDEQERKVYPELYADEENSEVQVRKE